MNFSVFSYFFIWHAEHQNLQKCILCSFKISKILVLQYQYYKNAEYLVCYRSEL